MKTSTIAPTVPMRGVALRPLGSESVFIEEGFWGAYQIRNRDELIPHCDETLERVGWVDNFRAAARGTLATDRVGRLFTDSELYKLLEAMLWECGRQEDEVLRTRIDELTNLIRAAQHEDGYLNTFYDYRGGPERYSDLAHGHELYCFGHLLQAAVAAVRVGGAEGLVDVADRVVTHLWGEFGPDGRDAICGHPEVETALVEYGRARGDERCLELARLFVERRGHRRLPDTMLGGRDYYQDNVPVRDASALVGHAVRALYLAAGTADVAVEMQDAGLLGSVEKQYGRTVTRRMYVTGGIGSRHHGESIGDDFELPSDRAYAETCAAVASVQVAWRLLLATGDSAYADIIEQTLYNGTISSLSLDGRSFFYVNTLHRRSLGVEPTRAGPSLRRTDGMRASWYTTSCCPTNLARLLSSLQGYVASTSGSGLEVHQYFDGRVDTTWQGTRIALSMATRYPLEGTVRIRVDAAPSEPWRLRLRVPAWARAARATVCDEVVEGGPGWLSLERKWVEGDEVTLSIDIAPRFIYPNPRIDAIRGCLAVQRGPLVYCLELLAAEDVCLDSVAVDPRVAPVDGLIHPELGGMPTVEVSGFEWANEESEVAYMDRTPMCHSGQKRKFALIPYPLWANRGPSTMRVWLPRTELDDVAGSKGLR